MKRYINKIHYSEATGFADKLCEGFLTVLSAGYYLGISIRNFLYEKEILKKAYLNAYVVSVGNLTTGGTGKTPITAEIAKFFQTKMNRQVAILSHGYGGQLSVKDVNIVSDGKNIFSTPYLVGDEPYWLASRLKGIPVLTGRNRAKTGKYAIDNFQAHVLILDDGFQHIKLERNQNILVIDSKKKFGNNKLLPAGPLREPLSEIKRADKIVIVNKEPFNQDSELDYMEFADEISKKYNKKCYICRFKNAGIYNIQTSEKLVNSQNIYAFAGIAQPESFFRYLAEQGLNLVKTREFSDHHLYTKEDLVNIIREAKGLNADSIVTTEKDAVKLLAIIDDTDKEISINALKLEPELDLAGLVSL